MMISKVSLVAFIFVLLSHMHRYTAQAIGQSKKTQRHVSFVGAPVDDVSSAATPAKNLLVRTNLKGKIKIVVNKLIKMADMKVNVKLDGLKNTNLSFVNVKFERKYEDPNTILLNLYEPNNKTIQKEKKLNKTNIIVIITTGSICLVALLAAVSGFIAFIFHRKKRERQYSVISDSYSSDDDAQRSCESKTRTSEDDEDEEQEDESDSEGCEDDRQEDSECDSEENESDSDESKVDLQSGQSEIVCHESDQKHEFDQRKTRKVRFNDDNGSCGIVKESNHVMNNKAKDRMNGKDVDEFDGCWLHVGIKEENRNGHQRILNNVNQSGRDADSSVINKGFDLKNNNFEKLSVRNRSAECQEENLSLAGTYRIKDRDNLCHDEELTGSKKAKFHKKAALVVNAFNLARLSKNKSFEGSDCFHDDEDYLSVHRHGAYSSFMHGDSNIAKWMAEGEGTPNNSLLQDGYNSSKGDEMKSKDVVEYGNRNNGRSCHIEIRIASSEGECCEDNVNMLVTDDRTLLAQNDESRCISKKGKLNYLDSRSAALGAKIQSSSSEVEDQGQRFCVSKITNKHGSSSGIQRHRSRQNIFLGTKGSFNESAHSRSNLNIQDTKTINGSNIGLATEDVRSASVSRQQVSSSEASGGSDIESGERKLFGKKVTAKGIKQVIEHSIEEQRRMSLAADSRSADTSRPAVFRSRCSSKKFAGNHSLFIVCLFTCLSMAIAILPEVNTFKNTTADITIEIPDGIFSAVQIFVNKKHKNPVTVLGEKHQFSLKIFEVNSASVIEKDKCVGKGTKMCDIGACDPMTGECVCPRSYVYSKKFQKCIADCTIGCPFESYFSIPCTKTSPGVCKRCRNQCPRGLYEITACGGTMNRECTYISKLPAVVIGENLLAENRKKVIPIHAKIYPKEGENSVIYKSRSTAVEVVITVQKANFGVVVGEVKNPNYDVDLSDTSMDPVCSHNLPMYYKAKLNVRSDRYYVPHERNGKCNSEKPKLENSLLNCLGSDHNIIRLFTHTKYQGTDLKRTDVSQTCSSSMKKCLDCIVKCNEKSRKPECSGKVMYCHQSCKKTNCDCTNTKCPCYKYEVDGCSKKANDCTGFRLNEISIEPVFSKFDQFCHVKVLRMASYEIRTDLYVNGNFIKSKNHDAKKHSRVNRKKLLEDDFGYMVVKMPDFLEIDNKDLLVKRLKHTRTLEIGHYQNLAKSYYGLHGNELAFMPKQPFLINKAMWKKQKCDDVKMESFVAFDKFPLTGNSPNIFKRTHSVSMKELVSDQSHGKNIGKIFSVHKSGMKGFLEFKIAKNKSVFHYFYPKGFIEEEGIHCRLINKTSHWLIAAEGYLKTCPATFSAKLFDQDQTENLLFHYDFVVTSAKAKRCRFDFKFNIPFKNGIDRVDKAFILHLISKNQTLKFVLLHERKIVRILQAIKIPKVNKSKFMNALVPIVVVSGGFVFLLALLIVYGLVTKPKDKQYQGDRDNNFHFRHAFVIVWFVGARIGKSLLFTITFMSYVIVVIHQKNYHTLKTFKEFQIREIYVYKNIFEDMERHRVREMNRQSKRLAEERNVCEMNMKKLDEYLSQRKRQSSWEQETGKRAKSIKLTAIRRFEENWKDVQAQFDTRKQNMQIKMSQRFNQMKYHVDRVKGKVLSHWGLISAKNLFKMYRFFGGSKTFAQYSGLDVDFSRLNYKHRLESFQDKFSQFSNSLKRTKSSQEKSENLNHGLWKKATVTRKYDKSAEIKPVVFPKPKIGMQFDKDKAEDIFAVEWVLKIMKNKIFAKIGMVLMITFDVLFFIYRHTRTYAMAVMMVYGFQKICDLDEMEKKRQEDEERQRILRHGLVSEGWQRHELLDTSSCSETIECNSDYRCQSSSDYDSDKEIVGDGMTTSTDEFMRKQDGGSDRSGKDERSTSSTSSCINTGSSQGVSSRDSIKNQNVGRIGLRTGSEVSIAENTGEFHEVNGHIRVSELKKEANGDMQLGEKAAKDMVGDGRNLRKGSIIQATDSSAGFHFVDGNLKSEASLNYAIGKQIQKTDGERVEKETGNTDEIESEEDTDNDVAEDDSDADYTKSDSSGDNTSDTDAFHGNTSNNTSGDNTSDTDAFHGNTSNNTSGNNTSNADAFHGNTSNNTSGDNTSNDDAFHDNTSNNTSGDNISIANWTDGDDAKDYDNDGEFTKYKGYYPIQQRAGDPSMAKEANDIALTTVSNLATLLYSFVAKFKILNIVKVVILNTHLILLFAIVLFITAGVYFTIITAKYVLRTPLLDELGFFDSKISPILTFRKVVNTRIASNAFMVNHVHIPYYQARINARIEIYRLKAGLYKKLQCVRSVLYNSELCSWKKAGSSCEGLKSYDEDFYRNLTKFKCHLKPAVGRRYSNFDRITFKSEMIRSYDPYIQALRGIILDTFDMIFAIIGIQIVLKISSKVIFKLLLLFDLIRQIKVYKSKRPIEAWDTGVQNSAKT